MSQVGAPLCPLRARSDGQAAAAAAKQQSTMPRNASSVMEASLKAREEEDEASGEIFFLRPHREAEDTLMCSID